MKARSLLSPGVLLQILEIIGQHMAAAGVWQEACTASHPDIRPLQLRSQESFAALLARSTQLHGGRLPPRSRLTAEQLERAVQLAPPLALQQVAAAAPDSPRLPSLLAGLFGDLLGALGLQ